MGRLWQTLILSTWNSLFAWLPVETLVKENQEGYYATLGRCDSKADCTEFIEFMLGMISDTLNDVALQQNDVGINVGINVGIKNSITENQERLLNAINVNPSIIIAQLADLLDISQRQAERTVATLKDKGKLRRVGAKRNGYWEVVI